MFSKLLFITAVVAVSMAAPQHPPAAQYPAGVNPQDCPGFPICDNARLHNPQAHWGAPAWSPPQPSWQPQPQQHWGGNDGSWQPSHNDGSWQPSHNNWQQPNAWNGAPAGPPGGADKFPAGVNPHSCPNYPFCDVNAGHHGAVAAPPLPGWTERLYPAGVSPSQCPNFPYCH